MKEPELVLSGFVFLIPAYVAWTGGQWLSTVLLTTLVITSSLWHTIHEEWVRPFDLAAMVAVFLVEIYNSSLAGADHLVIGILSCLYGLIAYQWVYVYTTFCFGESRIRKMVSHAMIHVVAATVITLNILKIQENEKSSSHSNRLS